MRYRLRTLLIVLALGAPVLAGLWFAFQFAGYVGMTMAEAWTVGK